MDNEVLQNIRTRRSCRAYTAQPVEPEKLKAIVEAGTWAASGMGRQAPKIVVLTDAAEIAELERLTAADTEKQGAGRSAASQNRS